MTSKDRRLFESTISLDPNRLWTFQEASYYLRVGDSTLRNYVRTGRLPAVRVGGDKGRLLLFRKADLDALLVPVKPCEIDSGEVSGSDPDGAEERD